MKPTVSEEMQRFNYLVSEIDAAYHEMSLALGLTDSAMQILYTICDSGTSASCSLQEICRRTGVRKQTINSALRRLEADGIVYLSKSGGREKTVHLTAKGQRLSERTARRMIEAENAILRSWPESDVQQYLNLTERFLRAFQQKTREITSASCENSKEGSAR